MPAAEPFPRLLRWALLGPFAAFAIAWLLAVMAGQGGGHNDLKGLFIVATGAAGLVELVAVPAALVLLVRQPRYIGWANILTTLVAGIPLVLVAFVAWVLRYGHFHI